MIPQYSVIIHGTLASMGNVSSQL